jgi:Peptidase S24-like
MRVMTPIIHNGLISSIPNGLSFAVDGGYMGEMSERLKSARVRRGFETATAAAEAMSVPVASYVHHENGHRNFTRRAEKYARFFGVPVEWLLFGKSAPDADAPASAISVWGYVGAGHEISLATDDSQAPLLSALPAWVNCAAVIVRGNSMLPRFYADETLIIDRRPAQIAALLGKECVVDTLDGRRMVKILAQGSRPDFWRLKSHNPMTLDEETPLLAAYRIIAILPSP